MAALTNNWRPLFADLGWLKQHFDHFVESCEIGMRKPEQRIYQAGDIAARTYRPLMHCSTRQRCSDHRPTGAGPGLDCPLTSRRIAFLDDLSPNIAAARQFGWYSIQVKDAGAALLELSDYLHEELAVGRANSAVIRAHASGSQPARCPGRET